MRTISLSQEERRFMQVADEIADRHAAGWLRTTRLVNKIRLRTAIFNALVAASSARPAKSGVEE